MFKIGDFAQIGRVTVRALHHYETLGLLQPQWVDPASGYRYYGLEQLPRLNRILALKDLGLSLDEIALLLDRDLSPAELRGMLRLKQAELAAQVADVQARLARVEARLKQIEEEGTLPDYEVVLKPVEPLQVACLRGTVPAYDQVGSTLNRLFDTVCAHIEACGGRLTGPGIALWFDIELDVQVIPIAAAVPAADIPPQAGPITLDTLPAASMACVVHHGSFDGFQQAYQAALSWIRDNGYLLAGPVREVYLQYARNGDPADYVTEIQFPVTPPA